MSPRYMEALVEVNYVINGLDIEDKVKIPDKFLDFIEKNKAKRYDTSQIDVNNLMEETYAILAFIYRKFLASAKEREELDLEFNKKLKIEREERRNITSSIHKDIDYSPKVLVDDTPKQENKIVEYKKAKWYDKIFNKIKVLFKK